LRSFGAGLKKYKLEFSQSAGKVLDRIYRRDKNLYFRLIGILKSVGLNPHEGKKLKGALEGYYSRRMGSCRIIYEIRAGNLIVYVIDIGYRREIYR
jgi:mRNA interferase RelE/StbE